MGLSGLRSLEGAHDFDHLAEFAGLDVLDDALGAGHEGELRTAADKPAGGVDFLDDPPGGAEVDAEGLFGEQIFARIEDVAVNLLVKMVGDGAVDDVDLGIGQDLVVVGREVLHGRHLAKPVQRGFGEVGDRGQLDIDGHVIEDEPASESRRGFLAHEAAADDAYTNGFFFGMGHCRRELSSENAGHLGNKNGVRPELDPAKSETAHSE
mgnify:CR=1 FL=1